ncbi:dihydrouridine synthase [Colletotrichum orchidophilum]|uniref:tRNA-dihydrouridine(47) synthase [NAD(P)(+)] n=1 Tax=Colletotrichum orchidophilum TaxID=1209926 RepID=A0A1G4B830_9PEZI|nr:dihydrouridine synthase [Colletotrichum orchidophilum]OHE97463.1 dihydrouridine synthase [Colletotrichum orchidophilum]
MENRAPQMDGSEQRAAKRLKVDDSSQQTEEFAKPAEVHAAEERVAVDEAPKRVELVSAIGNAEKAEKADVPMGEALAAEKPAEGAPANTQNGGVTAPPKQDARDVRRGQAPIKAEFLIHREGQAKEQDEVVDDDAAEGRDQGDARDARDSRDSRDSRDKRDKKKREKGQNKERSFGHFDDALRLCNTRAYTPEFSPRECKFGERCNMLHDLRKYLKEGRREDLETFEGKCPIFEQFGACSSGWKCRFVKSHMREIDHEDGRKELVLVEEPKEVKKTSSEAPAETGREDLRPGVYNNTENQLKIDLSRKRIDFTETDKYISWMNKEAKLGDAFHQRRKDQVISTQEDLRAQFVDPPLKPSEKRKLYFGKETPALAPLTTQGNLPFRRLCVELGAQLTYSEMALGMPLVQGVKNDWALMKAHETEISPPRVNPDSNIVQGYDNALDLKFGAQISGSQAWHCVKSADLLNRYVPHLRLIDLNCGCPIDMVFKSGGGSALLEAHGKLERMVRGMNTVSGEIPITVKLRTGVKQNRPTATTILGKLAFGSRENRDRLGAPGCAAITLHGRSREQRYTKKADWGYIAECAAMIKAYNEQKDSITDTVREADESTLPNAKDGRMFFLGNGDCYSHVEYFEHVEKAKVDTLMIGRGALVKPWLFEEIEKGQYLDKSATERLAYVEKFCRFGMEAWGTDELGIGFTRRFLLEWLSFSHRYVPLGLLEHLPPDLNDRPPAYRGRDDLETLLASKNYKDWIKISEMFLGPAHTNFTFQPKHKSHAYEAEG